MSEFSKTRRRLMNGLGAACVTLPLSARAPALNYEFAGPSEDLNLGLDLPSECYSTKAQTAGPFYTPSTPRRWDLTEPDSAGVPMTLEGYVLTTDCQPVPGAVVDIWHCDDHGRYDNKGFRYRGHQFTDYAGSFRFKTNRPARYFFRTAHIHAKIQGPNTEPLTTQVYFPDNEEANLDDSIFKKELLVSLAQSVTGYRCRFDFVVQSIS